MEHTTKIAASWVRDPILCAKVFDEFHGRFLDAHPDQVPVGTLEYDAGFREISPIEDLERLRIECRVLQQAYRLAQVRQPSLTVPIDIVNATA